MFRWKANTGQLFITAAELGRTMSSWFRPNVTVSRPLDSESLALREVTRLGFFSLPKDRRLLPFLHHFISRHLQAENGDSATLVVRSPGGPWLAIHNCVVSLEILPFPSCSVTERYTAVTRRLACGGALCWHCPICTSAGRQQQQKICQIWKSKWRIPKT